MTDLPNYGRIYLQPFAGDEGGHTWCTDRISDDDIEYVRAERVATLESTILTIIKAMNEYLPPTGGDKDKFISEVIGAVDNPAIVAALRTELDHAK